MENETLDARAERMRETILDTRLLQIKVEYKRALEKHPACPSIHHAISVIREEYLELEREVFTDGIDYNEQVRERARKEAVHLAATCIRMLKVLGYDHEDLNAK